MTQPPNEPPQSQEQPQPGKDSSPSKEGRADRRPVLRDAAQKATKKVVSNPFWGLAALVAALVVPGALYLGYDLAKGAISPCESLYRQTAVSLKTKIKYLKAEGEIALASDKVDELSERATLTAMNLRACCTVLNRGKVDPEQFLSCKSNAQAYDSKVGDVVELVRAAIAEERARASNATSASQAPPLPQRKAEIAQKVEAARQTSQSFNKQIVQVRKDQALERLEAIPPAEIEVKAQEREPNNDKLNTNAVPLTEWITGGISAPTDGDFYSFTAPGTHRDWIRIEIENRSTTLEPRLIVYDSAKKEFANLNNTTPGGNLSYSFVAAPDTKYYFRVSNYYGNSQGLYLVRVVPTQAYDAHEPNQTILEAKTVSPGRDTQASIMDARDHDYFSFKAKGGAYTVRVVNRSASLHPEITAFNGDKREMTRQTNTTSGGNISASVETVAGQTYFLRVRDYYDRAGGDYTLTVTRQ